jgi:hypothetical protein
VFASVQLSPLSVERKTPPPKYVPAKNVAAGIDSEGPNIGLNYVVINIYPTVSLITSAVDAVRSVYKISPYENVTIGVDSAFIKRKQAIINLLPILPALGRAKHAAPGSTGEIEINRIDVWRVNSWNRSLHCDSPNLDRN